MMTNRTLLADRHQNYARSQAPAWERTVLEAVPPALLVSTNRRQAEPEIHWVPRQSLRASWGRSKSHRSGTTLAELLVAATLLITGLTLISKGAVQTQRIWQATRHHQLALDELANQVDRLTAMKPLERAESLASLQPSDSLRAILDNPTLNGEAVSDEDGDRIVLSLHWNRIGPAIPVTLVGWIPPSPQVATPTEDDL